MKRVSGYIQPLCCDSLNQKQKPMLVRLRLPSQMRRKPSRRPLCLKWSERMSSRQSAYDSGRGMVTSSPAML